MATYTVRRELPSGRIVTNSGLTRRQALQTLGETLYYNNVATKAEAQRFAAKVKDGEPIAYEGFVFTVTKDSNGRKEK